MNSFILKIVGIITMLFDHTGDALLKKFSFCNLIGRLSFPLFAFQAAQGYIHTKNFKKHILKMFLFACISQIPFRFFLSTFTTNSYLNIFFTFCLGLIAIYIYDKCKNKLLGLIGVAIVCILGYFIKVDYGIFGILSIFIFYFFSDTCCPFAYRKFGMSICFILLTFLYYLPNMINESYFIFTYLQCAIFTCLSLIPILLYNGKEGPKANYFFYVFYPLHLLILYLLNIWAL